MKESARAAADEHLADSGDGTTRHELSHCSMTLVLVTGGMLGTPSAHLPMAPFMRARASVRLMIGIPASGLTAPPVPAAPPPASCAALRHQISHELLS